MPTENRSSNTEMVSVPRERLDALWRDIQDSALRSEDAPHVRFAAALLAQPAEQHQGELVKLPAYKRIGRNSSHDWDQGHRDGWSACLDELAKLGPLYTHPAPANPQSAHTLADKVREALDRQACPNAWMVIAYEAIVQHFQAPADPGEVERLRLELSAVKSNLDKTDKGLLAADAEVRRLRKTIEGMNDAHAKVVEGDAALRAQLAEREALLRDIKDEGATWPLRKSLVSRLETVLANGVARRASAEPSAPVEREELPEFARTVIAKLMRLRDCAEDGQDADIGRNWFDTLVQLGLLHRVQRSPARWEITCEGDALIVARAALERKPS